MNASRIPAITVRAAFVCALAIAIAPLLSTSAEAIAGDDPCVFVSKSDAAKAIGVASVTAKPEDGLSPSCEFNADGSLGAAKVTATRDNTTDLAHQSFLRVTGRMSRIYHSLETIANLGDEALAVKSTVYVRKGTGTYRFDINGRDSSALLARAITFARASLAHVH